MQTNLLNLLDKNWEYGVSPNGVWVDLPSQVLANLFFDLYFNELTATAEKFKGKVEIFWGENHHNSIEVHNWMHQQKGEVTMTKTSNLIWFANVAISPALLQLAADLIENPRKASVIRMSDERQIIMHDESKTLCPGHTLQEATNWARPQFWHPQDLVDFRRTCRQNLTADGESTLEYTWRSFDPDLGMNDPRRGNWLEFTTRYRLFDGNDGNFYQLSENLGMKEIEIPKG